MIYIILMKIGIFEIEFTTIISFLLGVCIGFILLLLVYALVVVSSLKSKNFIHKTETDDLTTSDVKEMVYQTQEAYKDKKLRGELSRMTYCTNLCKDLSYGIAVRYYPNSKHPFLELSLNELTILTGYITSRVDEVLNHRGIRMLRKLKVSTIVNISNKKKEIEESKAFQASLAIGKNLNKAKYVLSILNPINWGRKLIVDRVINIIVDKISLTIISIVGEETYKIYSKKVFNKDVEIDTGSDKFIEEMTDSITEAAKEFNNGYREKENDLHLKTNILICKSNYEEYKSVDLTIPMKKSMEVMINEKEEATSSY